MRTEYDNYVPPGRLPGAQVRDNETLPDVSRLSDLTIAPAVFVGKEKN